MDASDKLNKRFSPIWWRWFKIFLLVSSNLNPDVSTSGFFICHKIHFLNTVAHAPMLFGNRTIKYSLTTEVATQYPDGSTVGWLMCITRCENINKIYLEDKRITFIFVF